MHLKHTERVPRWYDRILQFETRGKRDDDYSSGATYSVRRAGADPESANSILLPFPDVKFQVAASNFRLPLFGLTTVALRVYVSSSFANTTGIVITRLPNCLTV